MPSPASGARTLLGLKIDRQIPGQQLGCPEPVITPIAAPTTPVTAVLGGGPSTIEIAGVGSPSLNDANAGGTITEIGAAVWDIVIDAGDPTSPNTFKWKKDAGSFTTGIAITAGVGQVLSDGVEVVFVSDTGHTTGDEWNITATPANMPGLITGASVLYKMGTIYAGLGETAASAASTTVAITAGQLVVTPVASPVPTTPSAVVLGRVFYRDIDGGGYKEIKRVWTNTTDPFTDNVAPGAEGTRTPRSGTTGMSAEQTAANFGFQFIRVDNATDFNRDDTPFKSTEQTGRLGEPRGIPGTAKYTHAFNFDVRIGTLVPLLASMTGKATATQNTAEPVITYGFSLSDQSADSTSLSALFYRGGDFRPQLFLGMKCSDIELALANKQAQGKAKLMGQHDTESGFGKALSGNTGTFASAPVVRGVRSDANAYSDSVYVKIVTAPAVSGGIGSFTVRATLAAAADATPSFGTAVTSTVYYDPTTKRQCHPAAIGNQTATRQQSAWIELWESTTGLALGFDIGENRKPFEVYFPGDVTALAIADVFEVRAQQQIPDVYTTANPTGPSDDGSYTGQRPRFTFTSRLTPAHVTITRGSSSFGQTILDAQTATLKIGRPVDEVTGLGPEAANPIDVDVFGKFVLGLDIDRRYITREFERAAKSDARFYAVVQLQSSRISVDPVSGTLSALREELLITLAQTRVDKTTAVLSGDKVVPEKITLTPEQPDDDTLDVFSAVCQTAHSWDFSRI